ncbi:MAG TPA: HAD family hydrolase [Verrucomicrobiae bacterium]|jgi:HAD superfamily hydrolase (TIGR01549 family)|nr:HAD family hydrolase [Verrucomicrobiae bacterium]
MIQAVIFDLDNCLSAADEPGQDLLEPVFHAIRQSNHGQLSEEALKAVYFDCWRHPLDWVAQKHRFSPEMLTAAWEAYSKLEVRVPMHGYADLGTLAELPVRRFLVTSGFRRMQESKIQALGFSSLFTAVYIDAIDEPGRKGKEALFREILAQYHVSPANVLVVGDNPDSEIAAGNRIGMATVQVLRPGVPPGTNASCVIEGLAELKNLIT